MDLLAIRTFLAVLAEGNLTRAALALEVAQSTVTFRLQTLERELGVKLIDRSGGRVRVTAAGRAFKPYAGRLVALAGEARARLAAEERGESGQITIATSTVPAEHLLPAVLARFRTTHPKIAFSVAVSDSRTALATLLAEQCDVALVGSEVRDRRLRVAAAGDDEIVLVAAPGLWPLSGRARASNPLAVLPLIRREPGSGTDAAVAQLLARRKPGPRPPDLEISSPEAARRCVLAGLGAGFLSLASVAADVAAGTLVVVPLAGTPIHRQLYAAQLRSFTPSAAVRELWRALVRKSR